MANFKHNFSFCHRAFITSLKELLTNRLKLEPTFTEAYECFARFNITCAIKKREKHPWRRYF